VVSGLDAGTVGNFAGEVDKLLKGNEIGLVRVWCLR